MKRIKLTGKYNPVRKEQKEDENGYTRCLLISSNLSKKRYFEIGATKIEIYWIDI